MQIFILILIIAAAVGFLGYRFYNAWFGKKKKAGCDKCEK